MSDVSFFKGQQAVFRVFLDSQELILNTKSWNVKVNVTKIADGVNGEDRDRLDRVVNYFEISADAFQRDVLVLQGFLKDIKNDDASVFGLAKGGGMRLKILDGSRKSFQCKEMTFDDWDFSAS